jgi:hypothetical protein
MNLQEPHGSCPDGPPRQLAIFKFYGCHAKWTRTNWHCHEAHNDVISVISNIALSLSLLRTCGQGIGLAVVRSPVRTLPPRKYGGALMVWPGMPFPNLDCRIHHSPFFFEISINLACVFSYAHIYVRINFDPTWLCSFYVGWIPLEPWSWMTYGYTMDRSWINLNSWFIIWQMMLQVSIKQWVDIVMYSAKPPNPWAMGWSKAKLLLRDYCISPADAGIDKGLD